MKHQEIRDRDIVDRYLMGKLTQDEEQRFEEHYLDCPRCQEQLKQAALFRQSLKNVVDQKGLATARGDSNTRVKNPGKAPWFLAAAAVMVALLSAGLFVKQRHAWEERFGKQQASLDALTGALTRLEAPRINPPHLVLEASRQVITEEATPPHRIALSEGDDWFDLTLKGAFQGFPEYRLHLDRASGERVWQRDGVTPNSEGKIGLSFPATLFPTDGNFALTLEARSNGRFVHHSTFSFHIAHAQGR